MAVSLEQFAKQLAASGLMTAAELDAFRSALSTLRQPETGHDLARELVRGGKLTKYQASLVLKGKTRGLRFGEYVVLEKLGAGGMGVVLKARHRRMERLVAVKVLPSSAMKKSENVNRFYREVKAAAKLSHPNIVTAYDASEYQGMHYLVMEYVDGRDLSAVVRDSGPLPLEQTLDCILQAARGLAYAHAEGVIHRDIKPANLLLDKKGVVRILDMGLARLREEGSSGTDVTAARRELTESGVIMGTVEYMSPEQAENTHNADHRSDIYSLGCTLYRLITGECPYGGDSSMQKLLAHREQPIPSLVSAYNNMHPGNTLPGILEPLDRVFQRMLAKQAEDRPQTMSEVVAELEAIVGPSPLALRATSGGSGINLITPPTLVEPTTAQNRATHGSSSTAATVPQSPTVAAVPNEREETVSRRLPESATGTHLPAGATAAEQKRTKKWARFGLPLWMVLGLFGSVLAAALLLGPVGRFLTSRTPTSSKTEKEVAADSATKKSASPNVEVANLKNDLKTVPPVDPLAQTKPAKSMPSDAVTTAESAANSTAAKPVATAPQGPKYALKFAGNEYVELPPLPLADAKPFTVELWFKADRPQGESPPHEILLEEPGFYLKIHNRRMLQVRVQTHDAAKPTRYFESGQKIRDAWRHVALQWNGSETATFDNAEYQNQHDALEADLSRRGYLFLGVAPDRTRGYHGLISAVRISKSARYRNSIVNSPTPQWTPDDDTVALYNFEEGAGNVLHDSSGNGLHGKIVGATWVALEKPELVSVRPPPETALEAYDAAHAEAQRAAWAKEFGVPAEYAADRRAAEALHPYIRLTLALASGREVEVYPDRPLPSEPFYVVRLDADKFVIPGGFAEKVVLPAIEPISHLRELLDHANATGGSRTIQTTFSAAEFARLATSPAGSQLRSLELFTLPFRENQRAVASFPQLGEIYFGGQGITDAELAALSELSRRVPALTFYKFGEQQRFTEAGLAEFAKLSCISLSFSHATARMDQPFFAALAQMPRLQQLQFRWCNGLTDMNLSELTKSASLRNVVIKRDDDIPGLTARGMQQLADALPRCCIVWKGGEIQPTQFVGYTQPKTGETLDLLPRIDPAEHARKGIWKKNEGGLVSSFDNATSIEMPVLPGAAYRIEATAERLGGADSLSFGLVMGKNDVFLDLEGYNKGLSGISQVDDKSISGQSEVYDKPIFRPGESTQVTIEVRPGSIRAVCDEKTIVDWEGEPRQLSNPTRADLRSMRPNILFLGTNEAEYRISKLTYTPLDDRLPASAGKETPPASSSTAPVGSDWVTIFNGKDLSGWKINERPESWHIEEEALVAHGDISHIFYVGDPKPFKNFEFQCEVKTNPNSNGGICFHTAWVDTDFPSVKQGFESQVNNSQADSQKTGGLYNIKKVFEAPAKDDEYWTHYIKVEGKSIVVKINDKVVVDYTEPDDASGPNRIDQGLVCLQAFAPSGTVYYKNIKIKRLPD